MKARALSEALALLLALAPAGTFGAATAGPRSPSASVRVAESYLASPDRPDAGALARRALELAAAAGDHHAQRRLGELLYRARFLPRDDDAALAWLDRAAAAGDSLAAAQAGFLRMHRPDGPTAAAGLRTFLRASPRSGPAAAKVRAWETEARPAPWDWAVLLATLVALAASAQLLAKRPPPEPSGISPATWHEPVIAAVVALSCLALPGRYQARWGPFLDATRLGGLEGHEVLLGGLALAVLAARPAAALAAIRGAWAAVLLGAWLLADAALRPSATSLILAAKFQLPLLAGLALGTQPPGHRFWRPLAAGLGAGLALSGLAILLAPEAAIHQGISFGAWNGLFWHKNNLGAATALLCLGLLPYLLGWAPARHRRLLFAGLGMAAILLVGSRSRGAHLALLGALAVVALTGARAMGPARGVRGKRVALVALVVLVVGGLWGTARPISTASLGRTRPLGGRARIWAAGLQGIVASPLRGHGIGNPARGYLRPSAQTRAQATLNQAFYFQSAHNLYLDLALLLGLPAAALVLLALAGRAWRTAAASTPFERWVLAVILGYFGIMSMGETVLLRPARVEWLVVVACLAATVSGSRPPRPDLERSSRGPDTDRSGSSRDSASGR